jgi:hypothetical protein
MDAGSVRTRRSVAMRVPQQGRWPRAASAPKGRNSIAQGNALGTEAIPRSVALKGRDRGPAKRGFRPFKAAALIPTRLPRALPWAVVLRPFGAGPDRSHAPARLTALPRQNKTSIPKALFHTPTLHVHGLETRTTILAEPCVCAGALSIMWIPHADATGASPHGKA